MSVSERLCLLLRMREVEEELVCDRVSLVSVEAGLPSSCSLPPSSRLPSSGFEERKDVLVYRRRDWSTAAAAATRCSRRGGVGRGARGSGVWLQVGQTEDEVRLD